MNYYFPLDPEGVPLFTVLIFTVKGVRKKSLGCTRQILGCTDQWLHTVDCHLSESGFQSIALRSMEKGRGS